MNLLSETETERLDDFNPELERAAPFSRLNQAIGEIAGGVVSSHTLDKSTAAFSAAPAPVFTAPYAMRIIDVIVTGCADSASGTVNVMKGTDTICTAIACAADGAVTHMSAGATVANKARMVLAQGDVVNVQAVGGTAANIRGIVTVVCQRV